MAEKLTPQQYTAVHDRGGRLLISAAAGSGKTKVLVDRLISYLTDSIDPANIDEFLMITYTKAAAGELRSKIAAKLSERIAQEPDNRHLQRQLPRLYLTQISTVHAFCGDLLRQYAYQLDLPGDFRTADEAECREIRVQVMEELLDDAYASADPNPDFLAFVDTQGLGRNDSLVPQIIQQIYDSARCHLDPEGWLENCIHSVDISKLTDPSQTQWGSFLIGQLHRFLDHQIPAMSRCAELLAADGCDKPAQNFRDTVNELTLLRNCETWDAIFDRGEVRFDTLSFPRKYENVELKEQVKAVREACKDGIRKMLAAFCDPGEQVMADLADTAASVRGMIALVKEFSDRYERVKRRHRILDFSDLEHKTLDLLLGKSRSGATAAAREIGLRFREIMVDEYQDTNKVQDAIFDVLTRQRQNLFMVGDVKQSIYQFRLADPGIFIEKYQSYVPAEKAQTGQGRKVMLSSNFRSGGGVIDSVNVVFRKCMSSEVGGLEYGRDEALREGIPHVPIGEPEVEFHAIPVEKETYLEEASFVAQRIRTLLDGTHMVRSGDNLRPIRPEDIVILLRSPGASGQQYCSILSSWGIPCTTGGSVDLLRTPEISVLRSLLQIISNPRQDIPLVAVLSSPLFGFAGDDLAQLRIGSRGTGIYDAVLANKNEKSQEFLSVLRQLRAAAGMETLSELLERILLLTRLDTLYAAMPDGEGRQDNIHSFLQLVAELESRGCRDLEMLLSHLDALEEQGISVAADRSEPDSVRIMSIHKSKGLEFPVVFLCGLSRRFNRESLQAAVLCDGDMGLGLSCIDRRNRVRYPSLSKRAIAAKMSAENLSEELRILYVAMTRARDRLIMTYASNNLERDVGSIVRRMDISSPYLMTSDVARPGEWVLYTALGLASAGELFALGGRPAETAVSDHPWHITVSEAPEVSSAVSQIREENSLPEEQLRKLAGRLSYVYPHEAASMAPSKQTATQRKGRYKDGEAAENAQPVFHLHTWRKPSFMEKRPDPAEYGTAIHAVMQYIRYEACADKAGVTGEVERLVREGFLSERQGALADCDQIAAFFACDLGKRVRTAEKVLREFKFSVLDDGSMYDPALEEEKILLQGVVDCAIIEDDGITVVDFKTDRVTAETLAETAERYTPQIKTYAEALGRIYGMTVKEKLLYFFRLGETVPVE